MAPDLHDLRRSAASAPCATSLARRTHCSSSRFARDYETDWTAPRAGWPPCAVAATDGGPDQTPRCVDEYARISSPAGSGGPATTGHQSGAGVRPRSRPSTPGWADWDRRPSPGQRGDRRPRPGSAVRPDPRDPTLWSQRERALKSGVAVHPALAGPGVRRADRRRLHAPRYAAVRAAIDGGGASAEAPAVRGGWMVRQRTTSAAARL